MVEGGANIFMGRSVVGGLVVDEESGEGGGGTEFAVAEEEVLVGGSD